MIDHRWGFNNVIDKVQGLCQIRLCQYKLELPRKRKECLRGYNLRIKGPKDQIKANVVSLLTCLRGWVCWEYCRGTPQCPCSRWGLRWSRTSTSFYQRRWQGPGHRRWRISELVIKYLQGTVFQLIPPLPWMLSFVWSISNLLSTSLRKALKQVEFCISNSRFLNPQVADFPWFDHDQRRWFLLDCSPQLPVLD